MKTHPKRKHCQPHELKQLDDDILILQAYIRIQTDQMSDLRRMTDDNRALLKKKLREKKALMRRGRK